MQRTITLLFLIALGYLLKKTGRLSEGDKGGFSKLYLYFTLPAAIVSSFASFSGDRSAFLLTPVALLFGLVMLGTSLLTARGRDKKDVAYAAVNCMSINIGSFALPFLQGYLGPANIAYVMLYDVGNGILALGFVDIVGMVIMQREGKSGRQLLRLAVGKLLRTPSIWAYVIMITLTMLNIRLPELIYSGASIIGSANAVVAMLIIGFALDFTASRQTLAWIARVLGTHYLTVTALSLLAYFVLPLPHVVRATVVILLFSPISSLGLLACDRYGLDRDAAGLMNSITIVIGIASTLLLIPFFGLG
jgi:predicted permease